MSSTSESAERDTLTVAPREIYDLVFRVCRVRGCDAGVSDRIATNIAFAEIHHGGGLALMTMSLEGRHVAAEIIAGPDLISVAEVDAHRHGRAQVAFEPAMPLGAIASSLHEASTRGISAELTVSHGQETLTFLELTAGSSLIDVSARTAQAARHGVQVNASEWECLAGVATEFLVAEAILDSIDQDPVD